MMNSVKKKKADKTIVREHVVQAAAKAFTRKGVKTVRMDDIAADLSISKRTLYELFHDKEDLLLDVMRLHRKFFEDMEKYPRVVAYIAESRKENLDAAMEFYQKGVNQGIFRKDVNYAIVRVMVGEQMDILLRSEICKSYSLAEIYETVVFMHMRGISTEKGLKIVDNFLHNQKGEEYNKNG